MNLYVMTKNFEKMEKCKRKLLTMSMLEDFFDISRDSKAHFEGLEISKETELCREWLNQWPVVFISFKSAEGLNFETLLDGGTIYEPITENLTYDSLEASEESLWSLLFMTGYLTQSKDEEIKQLPV